MCKLIICNINTCLIIIYCHYVCLVLYIYLEYLLSYNGAVVSFEILMFIKLHYIILQRTVISQCALCCTDIKTFVRTIWLADVCRKFHVEAGGTRFHRNVYTYCASLHRVTPQMIFVLTSVIHQLDAQNFCFTVTLFHASTCFEHMCSSSGGQNCITQPLLSSHMCSKHVEAWTKVSCTPLHEMATYRGDDTRGCVMKFWPPND